MCCEVDWEARHKKRQEDKQNIIVFHQVILSCDQDTGISITKPSSLHEVSVVEFSQRSSATPNILPIQSSNIAIFLSQQFLWNNRTSLILTSQSNNQQHNFPHPRHLQMHPHHTLTNGHTNHLSPVS